MIQKLMCIFEGIGTELRKYLSVYYIIFELVNWAKVKLGVY